MNAIDRIGPFAAKSSEVHVIIDTPRGSRNKYKWDAKLGIFKLSHILTAGAVFPFDFGFVPGTRGADGDALDILVLTDEPLTTGCLIQTRLIGVIEAEQTEADNTFRNDRMLGVASSSRLYSEIIELSDLPSAVLTEVEQFFINYNLMRGRRFKPLARRGAAVAKQMVKRGTRSVRRRR